MLITGVLQASVGYNIVLKLSWYNSYIISNEQFKMFHSSYIRPMFYWQLPALSKATLIKRFFQFSQKGKNITMW